MVQIREQNRGGAKLNALISTVSEDILLNIARSLDKERAAGKCRSRLHGIPFIAKDTMWSEASFGVPTTGGTVALEKSLAKENAAVVQILVNAGMILLGKTNLSELGGAKDSGCIAGWSALGGQTQSAYVLGGVVPGDSWLGHSTPGGSSSGSAVAVSAGMAPIALGTETDGSILMPSDRASLYSVKPTHGLISTRGTLPYIATADTVGPMGKSAEDIALMLGVLLDGADFAQHLTKSFKGLRVGFLDPIVWASGPSAVKPDADYDKQYITKFESAMDKIEAAGAIVKRNITLRRFSSEDSTLLNEMSWHDYPAGFANFTGGLIDPPVRTMEDLVTFNEKHAPRALPQECPGQDVLEAAIEHSLSDEKYEEYSKTLRYNNKDLGVDKALDEYDLDVIIGAPTGRTATVYAMAGCPVGTLPLGYARLNGRPFGMAFVTRANREDLIIRVMSAWETIFGPRMAPPQLVKGSAPCKSPL